MIVPVKDHMTQGFGDRPLYYAQFGQKGHNGYDFGSNVGTPVKASADGTIHFEGFGKDNDWMGAVAGICIIVDHGTVYTGYAHLFRTIVNNGQKVKQGEIIGYTGATGTVDGAHIHWEVIKKPYNKNNGYYGRVDPAPYLKGEDMEKVTLESARILAYGILGRNGVTSKNNALDGDSDADLKKNHVGKPLTTKYLRGLHNSKEAKDFRKKLSTLTTGNYEAVKETLYRKK